MDEIKLKYFISAARHLSFTKAAEDCHVTQSAVSKQILALEEELGTQLFYRKNNALTLTSAGERLATKAEDYMEQYRIINEGVKRLHLEQEHRLTIGVGQWEWLLIPGPLALFSEKYPDVEIFVFQYTHKRLVSHLRTGTVDVGICTDLCVNNIKDVSRVSLGSTDSVITAHKDHDYWNLPEPERKALKNQTVITFYENEYEPTRPYCIKNNMQHSNFLHSNYFPTYLSLLISKMGIAIIPEFIKHAMPPSMKYECLTGTPLRQEFFAAKNLYVQNNASDNFIDICREYYEDSADLKNRIAFTK